MLSMHTRAVPTMVWRRRRDPKPVQDFLRCIVDDRLVLVVTPSGSPALSAARAAPQNARKGWRALLQCQWSSALAFRHPGLLVRCVSKAALVSMEQQKGREDE